VSEAERMVRLRGGRKTNLLKRRPEYERLWRGTGSSSRVEGNILNQSKCGDGPASRNSSPTQGYFFRLVGVDKAHGSPDRRLRNARTGRTYQ
jgi:hypothetical protein